MPLPMDPYDCLKNISFRLEQMEHNLKVYVKNQQVLDQKLNDIFIALKKMPTTSVEAGLHHDPTMKAEHDGEFDYANWHLKKASTRLLNQFRKK